MNEETRKELEKAARFNLAYGCANAKELERRMMVLKERRTALKTRSEEPSLECLERQMNKIGRFTYVLVKSKLPLKGEGIHRFLTVCLLEHLDEEGHTKMDTTIPAIPLVSRGVAICHIKDNYNPEKGRKTAARRALRAANHKANSWCRVTGQIPNVLLRLYSDQVSPVAVKMEEVKCHQHLHRSEYKALVGKYNANPLTVAEMIAFKELQDHGYHTSSHTEEMKAKIDVVSGHPDVE